MKGRDRRLWYEWRLMEERLVGRKDISCRPVRYNAAGMPTAYLVDYQIKSICGVADMEHLGERDVQNPPVFATGYQMRINLTDGYPSVDAPPEFRFLTHDDEDRPIPHPWHPNIRFFGDFAGRVCLNTPACGTFTDLAWYIDRVMLYLKYEKYHALNTPPFPEDNKVAEWVLEQAEPNGWIEQLRNEN